MLRFNRIFEQKLVTTCSICDKKQCIKFVLCFHFLDKLSSRVKSILLYSRSRTSSLNPSRNASEKKLTNRIHYENPSAFPVISYLFFVTGRDIPKSENMAARGITTGWRLDKLLQTSLNLRANLQCNLSVRRQYRCVLKNKNQVRVRNSKL